jgi:myo-inositol 2-dehydrogenase/D-chiro-inositol 1-dehydrogenase
MKRLNFGIFGVAHHHSRTFAAAVRRHPECRLIGVYDADEKLARNFAEKFDIPCYTNLEEFLGEQTLDVGVVTSENAAKRTLAVKLAKAKKHVLCDKPLGISPQESDEIIQACNNANVKLQVGYVSRYSPEALEAMKIIQSKKIGFVKFLEGENRVDVGSVKALSPWLANSSATGGKGALLEHAVHLADLSQWYVGGKAISVFSIRAQNLDESFEVEDNFSMIVTYSNGAVATIDGSYCRPSSGRVDDLVLKIVGSTGQVKILIQKKALLITAGEEPNITESLVETELSGRYEGIAVWNMIDDLVNSIYYNRTPLTSGEDAKAVNQLVEAAYQSLETGREIKIK